MEIFAVHVMMATVKQTIRNISERETSYLFLIQIVVLSAVLFLITAILLVSTANVTSWHSRQLFAKFDIVQMQKCFHLLISKE